MGLLAVFMITVSLYVVTILMHGSINVRTYICTYCGYTCMYVRTYVHMCILGLCNNSTICMYHDSV